MSETKTPKNKPTINRWDIFKVFLSSFFLQAAWNYRSLISIGFSVCLFPVVNKLYSRAEDKQQFLKRHLKFFNAHPYFASFALGVSIRLEEKMAQGETYVPELLDRLKNLLISPLGAVGDRLFWATIKPATLILGMVGVLLAPSLTFKAVVLLFTLLVYNIPHFYFRYEGILEGYRYGLDIYKFVSQKRFEKLRRFYLLVFVVSLIALVCAYVYTLSKIDFNLIIIFFTALFYAGILNKFVKNFYLVSIGTILFLITAGILFF